MQNHFQTAWQISLSFFEVLSKTSTLFGPSITSFPESQRVFDFHIRPLHPALGIAFPSIFFDDILGKQYGILFFYYSVNNGKIHLVFAIICRGIIFTSTRIAIRADGIVTVLKIEIGKIFTIARYFLKVAYNIAFGKKDHHVIFANPPIRTAEIFLHPILYKIQSM